MSDVFSPEMRSKIMSRIRSKDTHPEIMVRKILHRMGYRFRLHVDNLAGTPDIVLPRHRKVIFVHGCVWHGHPGCNKSKRPSSRKDFWNKKINKNIERDRKAIEELSSSGWKVLTIWECQTRKKKELEDILKNFLNGNEDGSSGR